MTTRSRWMRRVLRAGALAIALSTLAASNAAADGEGSVEGRVSLPLEGTSLSTIGPVVVYLEAIDAPAASGPPRRPVQVAQKNATFSPSFAVVSVGQVVEMPNADAIYHNVFSYSRPNDFDLGIYPSGESRSVTFRVPGVVKVYCSIHESMNATIVVVPTRHFAVAGATGRFSLKGVPPGRYRLRTFCERLPDTVQEIVVASGQKLGVDVPLTPGAG